MEVVSRIIKVQFPYYLKSLPIPSTFGGFAKLSGNEWVQLVPFVVTTSVVVYLVVSAILPSKPSKKADADWVNKTEQKEKEKVADIIQIEDLGEKTAFCRCWKSKKVCAYPPFLFLFLGLCAIKYPRPPLTPFFHAYLGQKCTYTYITFILTRSLEHVQHSTDIFEQKN